MATNATNTSGHSIIINNNNQQQQLPQPLQQSLPPQVEDLLNRVCIKKKQPLPDPHVLRKLCSLTEEKAVELLTDIYNTGTEIRTINGYITRLISDPKYQWTAGVSPARSPSKPFTHSPSKSAPTLSQHYRTSPALFHTQSSSFSVSPVTPPFLLHQGGETITNRSNQAGDNPQRHLEALGELEFRRQFLILNYVGKEKLENVVAPETIRSWNDLTMPLFENRVWEALGQKYIGREDRQWTFDWDSGKIYVYHCEVSVDGSYRFKGPYLSNTKRTLLQKILGDDNVLTVKFANLVAERAPDGTSRKNYVNYSKVSREGILVGLRRYRFFVFKDGRNKEKRINSTSSPVKCYFIRVGSNAAIDRGGDYKLYSTMNEARCVFMHPHTVSTVSKYMLRFSLILSKTESLIVDWSLVTVDDIDDEYCLDEYGNRIYRDGEPLIHTDGTGFISEDLASLCPKDLLKKEFISNEYIEPLLLQFRLFHKGRAVKGTFLVNKMLPPKTIQIRPSMVKVKKDPNIDDQTVNSLEIIKVSKSPKNVKLSRNLIALLCHGGVPKEYFMELLMKDLEDTHSVFCKRRAAFKVSYNYGEMDDAYTSFKMIGSGIPLEEPYLQHRLSILKKEENANLRKGKISSPQSYNLMGTTDPTGILEKDEVCILLDSGQMSGEVLVYRHPGLHFGDVHVLKATYVKEIESVVGNAKYAIFFSRKGPRSVADEMGGGDFDGDLYWVSRNPRLLECFKPSEPWIESSSTPKVSGTKSPSELLPDNIEDALIKLYMETRFEPSFAMSDASDNWLARMDQFLTLEDGSTDEKNIKKAKMLRLVDLYYLALDAPKNGGEGEVPQELKVDRFPHYMEKKNSPVYRSISILGSIYDTVNDYQVENASMKEIEKLDTFEVDVPEDCSKKWKLLYEQYRSEMSKAVQYDDRQVKNKRPDEVIRKYRELLYGCEDFEKSTRPLDEIFNEALAIYHQCYDYAWKIRDVKKCGFVWKVAGSALCKYYSNKLGERTFEITHSVLKDVCT